MKAKFIGYFLISIDIFILELSKMIFLIKYKIRSGSLPSYRLTVDQLAKLFNLNFEENKERKRNVTKILNGINEYLKYTNFQFRYIKRVKMISGLIQLNLNFQKRH